MALPDQAECTQNVFPVVRAFLSRMPAKQDKVEVARIMDIRGDVDEVLSKPPECG